MYGLSQCPALLSRVVLRPASQPLEKAYSYLLQSVRCAETVFQYGGERYINPRPSYTRAIEFGKKGMNLEEE